MRSTKQLLSGAAVLAASGALLVGCAAADDGVTSVCYVTAASDHAYATPANEGVAAAAAEAGVELTTLYQEFNPEEGVSQLNTCISQSPDGIILWPLDAQAYLPGLAQAQEAGIPVVLINTPMGAEAEAFIASFTGPDVVEEGELAAQVLHEHLGGEGDIVIIAGQAGNPTTTGRTDGFTAELEALGSNLNVLQVVNADFDQQKAFEQSGPLITQFGDGIDAVYANDDTMALGFIDAWTESGRSLDTLPPIVGINGQVQAFDAIRAGTWLATIVQSPFLDGELALNTVVDVIDGETVDKRIPLPLTVVTIDNVEDVEPAF